MVELGMTFEEAIFIGLDLVIEEDGTVRRAGFTHRSTTDIAEENRYGSMVFDQDAPQCALCEGPINDDKWKGTPNRMVCSVCVREGKA
jgi:hypothetical protein